jgi:MarR family transcriptional regulator, transcriptional regulator for hemolysin
MDDVADTLSGQASLLCELLGAATEPALRGAGLTPSAFQLLSAVRATRGGATQAQIASRLGVTPASLSEAVRGAVGRGHLAQVGSDEDRRVRRLALTPAGTAALQRVLRAVNKAEKAMVQGIEPEELSATIRLLKQVNRNLATIARS